MRPPGHDPHCWRWTPTAQALHRVVPAVPFPMRVAQKGPAMDRPTPDVTPERHLLAQLLTEGRLQAGLDIATAATLWGESPARLSQVEAGECVLDWWELRALLAVYGLTLLAFVTDFEARLAALGEAPAEESFLPGLR